MKNLNPIGWQNSEFKEFLEKQHYNVLEYFKTETNQSTASIVAFNPGGKIIFINSTARETFFKDEKEVIGEPLDEVFPVSHNGKDIRTKSGWKQLIREGLLINTDLARSVKTNGSAYTDVWLTGSPLVDQHGNLVGGVFCCRQVKKMNSKNLQREG